MVRLRLEGKLVLFIILIIDCLFLPVLFIVFMPGLTLVVAIQPRRKNTEVSAAGNECLALPVSKDE